MEDTKLPPSLPGPGTTQEIKAETDFDRSEPRALLITGLGAATFIGFIVVVLGIQAYYDHIREVATYQKVLVPVADDLKNLRTQENEELNGYKYIDRNNGVVQIPIDRAMQLLAQEAASNKLTYFQKPTPVKPVNGGGGAAGADGNAGNTNPATNQGAQGPAGTVGSSLRGNTPGGTGNTPSNQ
jgi:hypothetical protein